VFRQVYLEASGREVASILPKDRNDLFAVAIKCRIIYRGTLVDVHERMNISYIALFYNKKISSEANKAYKYITLRGWRYITSLGF